MNPQTLERALAEIARSLDVPAPPDLTAGVRSRIEAMPAARRSARFRPWTWTRRSLAIAAALVIVSSGIAVGTYLGVRGVRIRVVESPTPTSPIPTPSSGATMNLGASTSLEQARTRVSFPIRVPAALGRPDEVYVDFETAGGRVWMLYRSRPGLPELGETGAGLLVAQFEGRFGRDTMEKRVRPDQIRTVSVGGNPGLWIEGAHEVAYVDGIGRFIADTLRVSDSTLLWQVGTVTLRLESALPMTEAIDLAETMG